MAVAFQSTGYNTRSAKKKLSHGNIDALGDGESDSEATPASSSAQRGAVTTRSRAAHAAQAASWAEGDETMGEGGGGLAGEAGGPDVEMQDCGGGGGGGGGSRGGGRWRQQAQAEGGGQASAKQEHGGASADAALGRRPASKGGGGAGGEAGGRNPVVKLTVRLLHTYQDINEKYYAKHKSYSNDGYDDENGDYIIRQGDQLNDRYEVTNRPGGKSPLLGKGSFGQVVYAIDRKAQPPREVALKIIKNHRHWHDQAKSEIELLRKFTRMPKPAVGGEQWGGGDWVDYSNVVRILDDFVCRNHCCLVFELLPFTLYDLLKYSRFKGVSLNLVRKFAQNLVRTLDCLRDPRVDVIHCDLKPENVMLVKYNEHRVKIIDFGSSCSSSKQPFTYIQSRFYRAPEVLLCLPYGHAIDMWSLGCILVEMHVGQPLFNGKNELQQMIKICDVLGLPPAHMIAGAGPKSKVRSIFHEEPGVGSGGAKYRVLVDDRHLDMLPSKHFGRLIRKPMPSQHTAEEARMYDHFEDLLIRMLNFDPKLRITPAEALQHPFFGRRGQVSPRGGGDAGGGGAAVAAGGGSSDERVSSDEEEPGGGGKGRRASRSNKVDQEVQTGDPSFLKSMAPSGSRPP